MTKIKLICYSVIAAIICILFVLWRVSASNYKIEKTNKELLETQLKASQIAIENLKEYNKKIAEEMGKIEKEYNERFKNIPKDVCGDAKPSQELMQYLKKGE